MSEYIALYRKWRPSVFADVIGQEHITKVLRSEVEGHSVSHAYLFCGSRGTGKTTCAKILAKAVNCENPQGGDPCGKCPACLAFDDSYDIIEMDAASNNRVEDIRDLCEKVSFAPIEMKKRVYIIDEVHMLSTGAFNALLKTLEEPPAHVMFILATTELNKIPATILSRCKRFDFHRISPETMLPRLRMISDSENIGITDGALRLIAFLATGAMRDALSMLELFVGKKDIDRDTAAAALGVVGNAPILNLLRAVAEKDTAKALELLDSIYNASKDMSVLCSELAEMFRNLLIVKFAGNSVSRLLDADPDVISVLRDCEDNFSKDRLLYSLDITEQTQNKLARSGLSRRTVTEMMLIKLCDPKMNTSPEALAVRISELEEKLSSGNFSFSGASSDRNPGSSSQPAGQTGSDAAKYGSDTSQGIDDAAASVKEISDTLKRAYTQSSASGNKETISQSENEKSVPVSNGEDSDNVSENNSGKVKGPAGSGSGSDASQKQNDAVPEKGVEMLAFGELLEKLKANNDMFTYSMLSEAYAEIFGSTVRIYVNPMGFLLLSTDKEKNALVASIASKLLGMPVKVEFVQTSHRNKEERPDLSGL